MGAFVGADPAARIGPAGGEASFVPKRAEGRKTEDGGRRAEGGGRRAEGLGMLPELWVTWLYPEGILALSPGLRVGELPWVCDARGKVSYPERIGAHAPADRAETLSG